MSDKDTDFLTDIFGNSPGVVCATLKADGLTIDKPEQLIGDPEKIAIIRRKADNTAELAEATTVKFKTRKQPKIKKERKVKVIEPITLLPLPEPVILKKINISSAAGTFSLMVEEFVVGDGCIALVFPDKAAITYQPNAGAMLTLTSEDSSYEVMYPGFMLEHAGKLLVLFAIA